MNESRRLNILLFAQLPPPYHGFTVMNRLLLNSPFMQAFNVKVQLINFAKRIEDIGGKFSFKKIALLIYYVFQTLGKLIRHRFDYCIYPMSFTAIPFLRDVILLSTVRLFGVKIIYYVHGNNLPDFYARSPRWLKFLIKNFVCAAQAAIVVGENLKFNFLPFLPPERIYAVHNAVERFKTTPKPRLEAQHEPLQVLYLSNLTRSKGFFVLLEAIPKIIAQCPNVRFHFAGAWSSEQDKKDAEAFVQAHRLHDVVSWKGIVTGEIKEQLFYDADIFVFPTFYPVETFGIVNLEAMQAGLPIVTTNHAAIPEVVEDGINGFIVPKQDPDAVAEKVILLCKNAELRHRMRENNLRKYESAYTKEKYAERLIATIERIHQQVSSTSLQTFSPQHTASKKQTV